jgi:ribosomal protein S18 acetylase RimI-like enzyme
MSSPPSSPPPERIRYRRILEAADPRRIRELVAATGVFSDEEVRMAGDLARTTLSGTETYRWLLAESGGELVGYTCYDRIPLASVSFDLFWIAVAPSRQRAGLAAELVRRTAALAKQKGGIGLYAETSSRDPYAAARAFYARTGFVEIARFPDFYSVGDDKVVFRLPLNI